MSAANLPLDWSRRLEKDREQTIRAYSKLGSLMARTWRGQSTLDEGQRLLNMGLACSLLSHGDGVRRGTFCRLAREHAGLTQGELGGRLGITRQTVAKVEAGTKPIGTGKLCQAWAEVCGVPPGVLLLDSPPE